MQTPATTTRDSNPEPQAQPGGKGQRRTIVLPFDQWDIVAPIVRSEFHNEMPKRPESDSFIARFDGDRLAAFLHVEQLFHFNSLYVAPEYRDEGIATGLFLASLSAVPPGFSAIVLAEGNKWQAWARYVKARDLGMCRIFRKDLPYGQEQR
jgi:GNAT superfamily N-acetyltransferase